MSIKTKLSIAAALAVFALGSAAYASDASEIYGGTGRGIPSTGFVGNGAGYVAHRAYRARRGVDAYAKAGGMSSLPSIGSKSMLSPGSIDYEPDFNSH